MLTHLVINYNLKLYVNKLPMESYLVKAHIYLSLFIKKKIKTSVDTVFEPNAAF